MSEHQGLQLIASVAGAFWQASFGVKPVFWLLVLVGVPATITGAVVDLMEQRIRGVLWLIGLAACVGVLIAVSQAEASGASLGMSPR